MRRKRLILFWGKLAAFLCVLAIAVNMVGNVLDGGEDILQSSASLAHLPRRSADVLWLGTSHMNYNVIPQYLYDEYGITSAMATGNSVDLAASYHILRHALLRQSPEVVVLDVYPAAAPYCYFYVQNVLAMENRSAMREGSNPYNTVSGAARWLPVGSPYKIPAIWEAWRQSGIDGDAYFQITRLHSRVPELTQWNFEHSRGYSRYIRNFGYRYSRGTLDDDDYETHPYGLEEAMAANEIGTFWTFTEEQLDQVQLLPETVESLRRIVKLTQQKGIQLVLCAAPYVTNAAEEKLYAQVGKLAGEWGIPFVGLEASGIEGREYVRDLGHLNDAGARLYTEFWGGYFAEHFQLADRRESTDDRYAPWRDHTGSHDMQDTAMRLMDYEGGPNGYLELLSGLDEDYLVLITSHGVVYDGFTSDDYWLLTEELGAMDDRVEEWFYDVGDGTLDLALCGGKLLAAGYEPEGRHYELQRNVLGHEIRFEYRDGYRSFAVDGNGCGKAGEGMTISVYSRLDHMLMDNRTFDLTEFYFDDEY